MYSKNTQEISSIFTGKVEYALVKNCNFPGKESNQELMQVSR